MVVQKRLLLAVNVQLIETKINCVLVLEALLIKMEILLVKVKIIIFAFYKFNKLINKIKYMNYLKKIVILSVLLVKDYLHFAFHVKAIGK